MEENNHGNHAPELQFNEQRPMVLTDRNIALPLWLVVPILVGFTSVTVYLVNTLNTLNNQLSAMRDQLSQQWTISDAREFGFQLRERNKGMEIPDIYQIHRQNRQ